MSRPFRRRVAHNLHGNTRTRQAASFELQFFLGNGAFSSTSAPPALAHPFETENATRLDLAKWIVAEENPLTARVVSNVIWSRLFGVGLVSTPDDFGTRGERPSHPLLLDWLGAEFIRLGWSRKQLIRTILLSRTYRQSSAHRPELAGIDPNNRLLHRQNRPRVEAEIVRDLHLSVSGLLSERVGGESVFFVPRMHFSREARPSGIPDKLPRSLTP